MGYAIYCSHYDNSFSIQNNSLVVPVESDKRGLIEFQIFCPEGRALSLEALVNAPRPADDTYMIQIDDDNPRPWKLCQDGCNMTKFEFIILTYGFSSKLTLGVGKHDIRLWSLQDGALLQYLQISVVDERHSGCYFIPGN